MGSAYFNNYQKGMKRPQVDSVDIFSPSMVCFCAQCPLSHNPPVTFKQHLMVLRLCHLHIFEHCCPSAETSGVYTLILQGAARFICFPSSFCSSVTHKCTPVVPFSSWFFLVHLSLSAVAHIRSFKSHLHEKESSELVRRKSVFKRTTSSTYYLFFWAF